VQLTKFDTLRTTIVLTTAGRRYNGERGRAMLKALEITLALWGMIFCLALVAAQWINY
jgi:hypothetical protein